MNEMLEQKNIWKGTEFWAKEINTLTLRSCRREQLKEVAGGYPPARKAR